MVNEEKSCIYSALFNHCVFDACLDVGYLDYNFRFFHTQPASCGGVLDILLLGMDIIQVQTFVGHL